MPDGDDESLSRRDMLKGLGSVAAASMLGGSVGTHMPEDQSFSLDRYIYPLKFLQRTDWRNFSMIDNAIGHLDGANWDDYQYNKEHFWTKVGTFTSGILSGDNMNQFQKYSAAEGFVSTPDDGIGASVTEHGRISSLFFPHTAFTTHIPYFTHEDGYLDGAKPREGSFAGVTIDDETEWLWEETFDRPDGAYGYHDDAGMLDIGYEHDMLSIDETTYVLPDEMTVVRDYEITNTGSEPIDGSFLYYTQANVNDNQQNFILWSSDENRLTADETLTWTNQDGGYELTVGLDTEAETTITASFDTMLASMIDLPFGETIIEQLFDVGTDAYGLGDEIIAIDDDELEGTYLGGTLETDLDLKPGETESISVFLAGDDDPSIPEEIDDTVRQQDVEQYWEQWNETIETPEGMTEREQNRFEQAVRTLGMMHDPETGAVPAAPNLQPMYYPSWIRDASIVSVALAQAGKEDLATAYLGSFLPSVQEADGSFKQCYDATGGQSGIFEVENDQQPIFAWAVREVYDETEDDMFLESVWPALEAALDYTVDSIVDNGLLAATPDYAEMPVDIRQSLFTNAFAYRGLKDGAMLAEEHGKDGEKYRQAAAEIGDAAYREFIEKPDDVYTELTITGGQYSLTSIDSPAIWPTGWAEEYDAVGDLIDHFHQVEEDYKPGWIPGHLTKAAMLYHEDRHEEADEMVGNVFEHQNKAGDFVETIDDTDEHYFASPLGWSQASYLLAMQEKYTTPQDDVEEGL